MTAINRFIKEAKSGATEIVVRDGKQLRQVAEKARNSIELWQRPVDEIEALIRAGKVYLLGVPVRVIGSSLTNLP